MTATTATWAIPYAQSTDRLCDGHDITRSMALRVDAIMAAFDVDVEFLGNIPACRLQFSNAATQAQTGGATSPFGLFFDTVDYDTDGMTNLSVDSSTITYRRAGYYTFGGSSTFTIPPQTSGSQYKMSIFSTVPVNAVNGQTSRDSSDTAELSSSAMNQVAVSNLIVGQEAEVDMELSRSAPTGAGLVAISTYTNMYAHWVADL